MILTTKKQDKRTKRKIVHSLLGRQMKKNVLITVTSMRQRKVTEEIQRLSPLEFVVQFSTMEPQRDRWWAEPYQNFISDKHFHTSINLLVLYHSCCNLIGYQTHDCLKKWIPCCRASFRSFARRCISAHMLIRNIRWPEDYCLIDDYSL